MNSYCENYTQNAVVGEYRLFRADIWNTLVDEHAFTVYIFAPFLSCAMEEAFRAFRLKNNLYTRTIAPCDREETARVVKEEPHRIMMYHQRSHHGSVPVRKRKSPRVKLNC